MNSMRMSFSHALVVIFKRIVIPKQGIFATITNSESPSQNDEAQLSLIIKALISEYTLPAKIVTEVLKGVNNGE